MFRHIFGMSEYQKEIRRDLVARIKLVDQHLLKCMMFPRSSSLPHWKQEIYTFINDVDKVKGKNRFPDYKFIREAFSVHEDVLYNYIRLNAENYDNEDRSELWSENELMDKVVAYHNWLAYELSVRGRVSRDSVYSILNSICKIK